MRVDIQQIKKEMSNQTTKQENIEKEVKNIDYKIDSIVNCLEDLKNLMTLQHPAKHRHFSNLSDNIHSDLILDTNQAP